jgi:hypothetical protein
LLIYFCFVEAIGYFICGKHDRAAESDWAKPTSKNIIDHFERFIGILRFHDDTTNEATAKRMKLTGDDYFESQDVNLLNDILSSFNAMKFERDWCARRVDIIICPIEQHAFALLGWTGSRMFNRSMRLYSEKEFGYRVTSHGIYDHKNVSGKIKEVKFFFQKVVRGDPYQKKKKKLFFIF